MDSFKNNLIQFSKKIMILRIFFINNVFTDVTMKYKMIVIFKNSLQN